MQLPAKDRIEGANRPRQCTSLGNHIETLAALDGAHGNDTRLEGVDLTADQGLQMDDEMGGDHDGIHRFVGQPSVASLSENLDLKGVGGGHQGPSLDPDDAHRQRGPQMNTIHGIHPVEGAVLAHLPGSAGDHLFRMLE